MRCQKKKHRVGRPSVYGDKVLNPANWLRQRKGWDTHHPHVRGGQRTMRYRVEGPFIRDGLPDLSCL